MKIDSILKCAFSALILTFSLGTYAGGGGGGGGDQPSNDGPLPVQETCESNCGFTTIAGPDLGDLQSGQGDFSVGTINVSSSVNGFGGGTIYYPTNRSGQLAAISLAPGFTNTQSAVQWWGPVLASHGFVAITIDTNGRFDFPSSRSRQLDSALNYLIYLGDQSSGPLSGKVDEKRLATMGFSMGGGGALESASRNRLSATVPLAPWYNGGDNFNQINVPSMVMACESDSIAAVNSHASPYYNRIPGSTEKIYLEINNGQHNCATGQDISVRPLISTYGVSWMKRFLDKDARYTPLVCDSTPGANTQIQEFRSTCSII